MLRFVFLTSVMALASSVVLVSSQPVEAASKSGYVSKCKKPEKWNAVEGKCEKAQAKKPAAKAAAKKT
jgi:hypothetical protein